MANLPPEVTDFQSLVLWLLRTRHRDTALQMARHLKIASGTVDKWRHGITRNPALSTLTLLAERYRLPLADVIKICAKRVAVLLLVLANTAGSMSLGVSDDMKCAPSKTVMSICWRWLTRFWPLLAIRWASFAGTAF